MTDLDLLLFGCVVSFIAAAGAYVALRQGFGYTRPATPGHREAERRAEHARTREALLGHARPQQPAEEGAGPPS